MKNTIPISITFLFILWISPCQLLGQELSAEKIEPARPDRKWYISFSLLAGTSGTRNGMVKAMEKEGYSDTYYALGNIFGFLYSFDQEYPIDGAEGIIWDGEVRRKVSPSSAIALTYEKSRTLFTQGHNFYALEHHHFLGLETRLSSVACDYIFTKKNSYTGIRAGLVMAKHQVNEYFETEHQEIKTTIKPGLHLGFDVTMFEIKSLFMAFSMDYTWLTPVTIGPYSDEVYVTEDGIEKTYTSVFSPVDIPLSSLKFGITTGWRF